MPRVYKKQPLNARQRKFCEYYMQTDKGKESAIKAGYAPASAKSRAYKLLISPAVKRYLQLLYRSQLRKFRITKERIVQEYACIAFANPADIFTDKGLPKNINEIPEHALRAIGNIDNVVSTDMAGKITNATRIQFANKVAALDKLSRLCGYEDAPEEQQQTIKVLIKYAEDGNSNGNQKSQGALTEYKADNRT